MNGSIHRVSAQRATDYEATMTPHPLLDYLLAQRKLRSDRALAKDLGSTPSIISRVRNGKLNLGPAIILRIHEKYGIPVVKIREMIGTH
jgi:antitoxin component HigA of HigAB toxin-antitoxin module